jgi:predicted nucleic acid-binding protein
MENIKAFLDTDIFLNCLCKEVASNGKGLWEAPYKILKRAEQGKIILYTTLINLMEIRFVLRRKKKWAESEIEEVMKEIREINNNVIKGERVAFDPEAFLELIGDKT